MAYRILTSDSDPEAALRRIAGEQIDAALARLERLGPIAAGSKRGGPEAAARARGDAVHDVRKRCKKLRALLRLVRPSFPAYAEENAVLRDVARLLGAARDAKVMQDTCDAVLEDYEGTLDRAALAPVCEGLSQGGRAGSADTDLDARFAEARERLQAVRERVRGWRLEVRGWEALGPGLARVYAGARKARKRAAGEPRGEAHHEWRKRVKDHWYHTRLLHGIWPERMEQRAGQAKELAELLGDHHDCHVLEDRLAADPAAFGDAAAVETIIALARRRRALLEERAHRLGKRLQADKSRALAKRWGRWWHAWHGEGELHEAALAR